MLEQNKPIYARKTKPLSNGSSAKPIVKLSPEDIERKQLQHDDAWLFEQKGKTILVVFTDGERLAGILGKIRKFSFLLTTPEQGTLMVYKAALKYVGLEVR